MCGVIGAILKSPSRADLDMVKRVFIESQIRGRHATGLSWVVDDEGWIDTAVKPGPAESFEWLNNLDLCMNSDGNLYLIGHCRYSTSDVRYNQPLCNGVRSVAHNGVITQELPERWQELYGVTTKTRNDSELLLHAGNPLQVYQQSSMAVCEVTYDKTFRAYRNGKRPLYITRLFNGYVFTSTADIARRARVGEPTMIDANVYYDIIDFELSADDSWLRANRAADWKDYQC